MPSTTRTRFPLVSLSPPPFQPPILLPYPPPPLPFSFLTLFLLPLLLIFFLSPLPVQDGCGCISADKVREIFIQFNVPLTPDMLELLLTWCVVEGEEGGCEGVMYHEMVHMLNWKTEVPDSVITTVSQSHTGERDVCIVPRIL